MHWKAIGLLNHLNEFLAFSAPNRDNHASSNLQLSKKMRWQKFSCCADVNCIIRACGRR